MLAGSGAVGKRSVVLVDPHRDLAAAALALVPPSRHSDVVYLDVSNRRRPFGINLLDTGLGWDRDQATANALRIFRREFEGFWGPRMEDAFRFAVLALFEANQAICAQDPRFGRGAQHTILDVPAMLARRGFRQQVLKRTQDPLVRQWFDGYFADLESRQRLEIINPVQTKVHKYLGSLIARQIVGQPRSTIDFRQLLAERKIVIVNLNAFDVGEDVAALVGGTLLNLAARAVSAQSMLKPENRQPVTLIVDEFGLDSDNGTEFINRVLLDYCTDHGITFTRSRPYLKNDTCHVEQKNWAVVRRLVGYDRLELPALPALERIHDLAYDYINFLRPVRKLVSKTRRC
jgi:hypothetical protein